MLAKSTAALYLTVLLISTAAALNVKCSWNDSYDTCSDGCIWNVRGTCNSKISIDCNDLSEEDCISETASNLCTYQSLAAGCYDSPSARNCTDLAYDADTCQSSSCQFTPSVTACQLRGNFTCNSGTTCDDGCQEITPSSCEKTNFCEGLEDGSCPSDFGCVVGRACEIISGNWTSLPVCDPSLSSDDCTALGCEVVDDVCQAPTSCDNADGSCIQSVFCKEKISCSTPDDHCSSIDNCNQNDKLCALIPANCTVNADVCAFSSTDESTCADAPQCEVVDVQPPSCAETIQCDGTETETQCQEKSFKCTWYQPTSNNTNSTTNSTDFKNYTCNNIYPTQQCHDIQTQDVCMTTGCLWDVTGECTSGNILAAAKVILAAILCICLLM